MKVSDLDEQLYEATIDGRRVLVLSQAEHTIGEEEVDLEPVS